MACGHGQEQSYLSNEEQTQACKERNVGGINAAVLGPSHRPKGSTGRWHENSWQQGEHRHAPLLCWRDDDRSALIDLDRQGERMSSGNEEHGSS